MPYVKQERREQLDSGMETHKTVGDLNYQITKLCVEYVGAFPSYKILNDVIGVLECAKQEFYRRVAAPYENIKIHENGDVYK
jgi:hypothetical protein